MFTHRAHRLIGPKIDGWQLARDTRDNQLVLYRATHKTPEEYDQRPSVYDHYAYIYARDGVFFFSSSDQWANGPLPPLLMARAYEYMAKTAEYAKGGRYDMTKYLQERDHG